MNQKDKKLFLLLFVVGLVAKICMIFYEGQSDMLIYQIWGKSALQLGMVQAYRGIYFPVQYGVFELCEYFNTIFNIPPDEYFIPYKLVNLIFDFILFVLLLTWLRKRKLSYFYGFLYWLNPYFLVVFSLGYIDFQFSALLLMALIFLRDSPTRGNYFWAGIPLGIAFLMKPQVQAIVLIVFIYCFIDFLVRRRIVVFFLLLPSVLLFAFFNIFFAFQNPEHPLALVASYLDTSNVMPCLTANMPNLWYPLAYLMKKDGAPIWSVPDTFEVVPHLQFKFLVIFIFVTLICYFCYTLVKKNRSHDLVLLLVGFVTLLTPFLMTNAHDNHFFPGIVLLVLFWIQSKHKLVRNLILAFFFIQTINLLGYYGFAKNNIYLVNTFSEVYKFKLMVPLVLSIVSIPLLVFLLRKLFFEEVKNV